MATTPTLTSGIVNRKLSAETENVTTGYLWLAHCAVNHSDRAPELTVRQILIRDLPDNYVY